MSQDRPTPGKKLIDREMSAEDIFFSYGSATRRRAAEAGVPYHLDIELLDRCTGGCLFCFNQSNVDGKKMIPRERLFRLLDEGAQLGTRQVLWQGGEPLFYPYLLEASDYAAEKGIRCAFFTSGIPLTPEVARKICQQPNLQAMAINIDTIDQAAFNKLHSNPKALQRKIEGYRTMLEAGFPPSRIFPSLCLTRPAAETVEETIAWFVEEMGARHVFIFTFVPWGYATNHAEWEPSLSQVRHAMEVRAKYTSDHWLRIGPLDCNVTHCRIKCYINYDGKVLPCNYLVNRSAGNIYEKSFVDIHEPNKEMLHYLGWQIKGKCGECENLDVCFGCRGKALHYLGDDHESDPKCWMNPAAKEYYCR